MEEEKRGIEEKAGQHRGGKVLLIGVIFLLLCIPSFGKLVRLSQVYPITENRERAQRPPLGQAWKALLDTGEYCSEFEAWFNDNFQLRDLMIRTKNQLAYSLFGLANGVYIDHEGYLYYQSVVAVEQISNEKMSEQDLRELTDLLLRLKDVTEEKGAEFYCMFPPQKNTVFSERADELPVQRPEPNRYELWCGRLESGDLADSFVNVLPALREARKAGPIYYKTDFHWNAHGATAAFTELANRIAGRTVYSPDQYRIGYGGFFQGGQLNQFSVLKTQGETEVYAVKNGAVTMQNRTAESPIRPVSIYLANSAKAPLGRLLIIGDSYTLYMMAAQSGLFDCFSEVYFVNMNQIDYAEYLSRVEPGSVDYLLFEKIESSLYNSADILRRLLDGEEEGA